MRAWKVASRGAFYGVCVLAIIFALVAFGEFLAATWGSDWAVTFALVLIFGGLGGVVNLFRDAVK